MLPVSLPTLFCSHDNKIQFSATLTVLKRHVSLSETEESMGKISINTKGMGCIGCEE